MSFKNAAKNLYTSFFGGPISLPTYGYCICVVYGKKFFALFKVQSQGQNLQNEGFEFRGFFGLGLPGFEFELGNIVFSLMQF